MSHLVWQAFETRGLALRGLGDAELSLVSSRQDGTAPHSAVSFDEATNDLPAFEVADPYGAVGIGRAVPTFKHWELGRVAFDFHVRPCFPAARSLPWLK